MRRRVFWMFVVCLAVMGCQSTRPVVSVPPADMDVELDGEAVTAAALVFDPPVIAGEEPLELGRAERAPGAFVGYDGPTVEYLYVRFDDSQIGNSFGGHGGRGRFGRGGGGGNYDRYERRAVTERIGVRYR